MRLFARRPAAEPAEPAIARAGLERALERIGRGRALAVGDACAVSLHVHLLRSDRPSTVFVLGDQDAGEVFYGRSRPGQIWHVDFFHAVARLDPRAVARFLVPVFARPELVDIQTGAGGGRLNGRLVYGQGEVLRAAHRNHVHLAFHPAAFAGPPDLVGLVLALERALEALGVEPRRIDELVELSNPATGRLRLDGYHDASDSFLRGPGPAPGRERVRTGRADEGGSGPEAAAAPGTGGAGEARATPVQHPFPAERTDASTRPSSAARSLERELKRPPLLPGRNGAPGARLLRGRAAPGAARRDEPLRTSPGWQQLDLAGTVRHALAAGGVRAPRELLRHLRVLPRRRRGALDICLLLDASASMAGARMAAARRLVRHLALQTRDRVAIIVFQDRTSRLHAGFTRRWRLLAEGLDAVHPSGLTPLAEGLVHATRYVAAHARRKTLLLLLTDGIPTVPRLSLNPLQDAVEAAREIRRRRLAFACVGLAPNEGYLRQLCEAAGGRLYVLPELESGALVRIAESERQRVIR
ncbi:MAG: VWA domain-containing protein [Bacillota bacterium]|nr:VWA domain-containing protein [Bacillota bacterium]